MSELPPALCQSLGSLPVFLLASAVRRSAELVSFRAEQTTPRRES